MITHLNYIEDKELRDYIYDELNEIRGVFNYIAVDDEFWGSNQSKIYAFKSLPDKNNFSWIGSISQELFYDSKYITSSPSVYDVFNTTRDIFDIEKILKNWEEDQKENISYKQAEDILNKILNNFGLKVNRVFQHRFNNKFFRINKHADIEEYINNGWRVTNLYEFINIIDDLYDDCPIFKYNVEKQFEEFRNKEKEKTELSSETKRVIKSILNTNYTFMKIYSNENKIVLHMNLDSVPLIISTTEKTIIWFKDFIKNNTSGNKILYISRLKTFWEEYNHE